MPDSPAPAPAPGSGHSSGRRPRLRPDGGTDDAETTGAETGDGADGTGGADGADGDDDTDRRRLIMYVLIIAFAVPLIVEGVTFVGLVGSYVGGPAGTAAPTATPTPTAGVAEGEELLTDTDRSERVSTVTLRSGDDGWTLTVTVQVENTGDVPYELRLGAVTTDGGRRVAGSASSGRLVPGGSVTVSAQWDLPAGDRPSTLVVTAVEFDDGEQVLVDREVRVGRVPVQG
jgi:hypothetical protein